MLLPQDERDASICLDINVTEIGSNKILSLNSVTPEGKGAATRFTYMDTKMLVHWIGQT